MSIKLVASDLDGTIIDENNHIAQNNFDAIEVINNKNIGFAICTGKTYPVIKNQCSNFNASFGIFGNGNQVINLKTGEEIYKQLLINEDVKKCINLSKKNNIHIHMYTDKEIITEKLEYMDLRNYILQQELYFSDNDLKFIITKDISEYIKENNIEVIKLVISSDSSLDFMKEELMKETKLNIITIKKYGAYKDLIINKEYEYLDITPEGTNKSSALTFLTSYLNLNSKDVMAIGDNLNDLEMVKDFGVGVAVANAYDEVKKNADFTTKNNVKNGGFAEAIYKYIV